MPLVYACIRPHATAQDASRTIEALRRVDEELAAHEVETVLIVTSRGSAQREAMGVLTASHIDAAETDGELAASVLSEATKAGLRTVELRRWEGALPYPTEALRGPLVLPVTTCWLDLRTHFEFGRAAGRAVAKHARRVALVCCAELSRARSPNDRAGEVFDEHYRRAIDGWDVKWLVGLERDFRKRAAEDAAAQTAVLMGALSGLRLQPRVLSYEAPAGIGHLVVAIDVLGTRMKERTATTTAGGGAEAEAR